MLRVKLKNPNKLTKNQEKTELTSEKKPPVFQT